MKAKLSKNMELSTIIFIVALVFSIIFHELAHGYAAYLLGDKTAKYEGRLTLNPIPHIDIFGSILIPGFLILSGSQFLFGWAKPVPYNPYNLKRGGRFAEGLVAFAGPLANILLAVFSAALFKFSIISFDIAAQLVYMNIFLAILNLVPIPPLDGSKILPSILPAHLSLSVRDFFARIESFGIFAIFLSIFVLITVLSEPIYKLTMYLSNLILF